MSDLSGVTADTLRKGILKGLLGPGARFEDFDTDTLEDAILESENQIQHELSTRFDVTTFKSHMLPGVEPTDPGIEFEGPYEWPASIPGDNFPRIRLRIRPVVELVALSLSLPGGIQTGFTVPIDWFRVDHLQGELIVTPSLFSAPLQGGGLTGPLMLGLGSRMLPKSVLIHYRAGLGEEGLRKWGKVKRLVELASTIRVLPHLSILVNPDLLTSQSADGLSQSRTSGYVYKDLEDRLEKEYENEKEKLLNLWDGPGGLVVL